MEYVGVLIRTSGLPGRLARWYTCSLSSPKLQKIHQLQPAVKIPRLPQPKVVPVPHGDRYFISFKHIKTEMAILYDWDSGKETSIPGVRDHERMRSEGDAPEQSVIFNYRTYVDTRLPGHSEKIVRHFTPAFERLKEADRNAEYFCRPERDARPGKGFSSAWSALTKYGIYFQLSITMQSMFQGTEPCEEHSDIGRLEGIELRNSKFSGLSRTLHHLSCAKPWDLNLKRRGNH